MYWKRCVAADWWGENDDHALHELREEREWIAEEDTQGVAVNDDQAHEKG